MFSWGRGIAAESTRRIPVADTAAKYARREGENASIVREPAVEIRKELTDSS